jgi:ADP-heptose:LPS heptosyltransferase
MEICGYEENFGSVDRRARRLLRGLRWRAKSALGRPRSILVETRWRLGDEIMALPTVEALAREYPGSAVHVLTEYPYLFEGNPHVAGVNTLPAAVDRYILLRGVDRREPRQQAYARRAGIPEPITLPHLFYTDLDAPPLARGDGTQPCIAIAPETTWPTKHWRMERWRELVEALQARGAWVVALGQTPQGLPVDLDLAGKTSVREAAGVLHQVDRLISCDSGLMHLALAGDTPVTALFGPTDPAILFGEEPRLTALCSDLECAGHWNHAPDPVEAGICPWEHACCLDSISVADVLDSLGELSKEE